MSRIEILAEGVTLYLGDCRDVLPPLGLHDVGLFDPPYGQKIAAKPRVGNEGKQLERGNSRSPYDGSAGRMAVTVHETSDWDNEPPTAEIWSIAASKATKVIAFGFNRLAHLFGSTPKLLIWDKKGKNGWDDTFADAEVAWTRDVSGPTRVYRHLWVGGIRASEHHKGAKVHPAQKPIAVMDWCLNQAGAGSVLDPWMGAGSTGIAAVNQRRSYTGIEINPAYFDIARRRIAEAIASRDAALLAAE